MMGMCRFIRDFNSKVVFDTSEIDSKNSAPYVEIQEDGIYFIAHEGEDVYKCLSENGSYN